MKKIANTNQRQAWQNHHRLSAEKSKVSKIDILTEEAKAHLDTDEEIVAFVEGRIESVVQSESSSFSMSGLGGIPIELGGRPIEKEMSIGNGIFVATNKRIVLYHRKTFGGYDLRVFFYSTISSIEVGKKWNGHHITFSASEKMRITRIQVGDVQKFVEYVRSKIEDTTERHAPPEPTLDIPDQIRKLAELKDQGILTEEEFESKKKNC